MDPPAAPSNPDLAHNGAAQRPSDPANATVASATEPAALSVHTLTGIVKSGNTPIPGATVTATNPSSGDKVVGWTQADGSYKLQLPAAGEWVVRAQMAAFATAVQHVNITPQNQNVRADLSVTLLSRAQTTGGYGSRMNAARGFQALSVMQGEGGLSAGSATDIVPSGMPVPGMAANISTESVSVNGSTNESFANMSSAEMQARFQEYRQQNGNIPGLGGQGGPGGGFGFGGPGGPGGGPPPGGGGGPFMIGGRRGGFNFNQPHGTVYYQADDAAFDAAPYSLRGTPTSNPAYLQQRFGAAIGGPLIIPHLYKGSKTFFFLHYNGTLGSQPFNEYSTVPTLLERAGNFSEATADGSPVQIFDPVTGQAFANATIPSPMLNSAALGLLKYIPEPNLPGTTQNFHYLTTAVNDSNDFNIRVNQALGGSSAMPRPPGGGRGGNRGPQNNLNFGFHYHGTDQTLTSDYPSVGGRTKTTGYDVPIGYVRSFGKLINNFRVEWNRSEIQTNNLYAFTQDITGDLGITGVSTNPFNWGLPNLTFTNFGGITDFNPVLDRNQTWTFADQMIYTHGKHVLRWGGDFRRIQVNTETSSNPRGSFVFTGLNTSEIVGGLPVTGTGYDFADFLLGYAQQTSVQYATAEYGSHFRGNSWDLYVQDEWRARGNLTFNLGLRYEYISPYSEINNRVVNLDTTSTFNEVAPVQPGETGPYTGYVYPNTLMKPDRLAFAPRLGIAWKAAKNTVVRGGYGINYNTSAYQNIVQNLAFQPPFSVVQTNLQSAAQMLTLQNGFPTPAAGTITNNYAIDPNYRMGYVQIWNVDVQQELTRTLLLNVDYVGTWGSDLDILEAPNRTASGVLYPTVPVFYWEASGAYSNMNALSVRVRKRLARGISAGGTFTYSKALDDASTIGTGVGLISANGTVSGQTSVAQNPQDLGAEYGLSSFDQRFRFTGDYLYELPFGHEKTWLNQPGIARDLLGDWQFSGDWTIASGLPFTPRLLNSVANVNSGVNGTLRPDITGEPVGLSNPTLEEFFNTAAFLAPALGQYGDARRNSIEGPGSIVFDMSMTKVIPMKESRNLELRMTASNVFNHANWATIDTVVNSPTFGRVISVGSMRTVEFIARFRF